MIRLIIPVFCLLVSVVACGTSDSGDSPAAPAAPTFDPVGTWTYDQAATAADPGNAGHEEEIADIASAQIFFILAADGSGTVSEGGDPGEATYTVGDGVVAITVDGDTLVCPIQGQHLTIPNPKSDEGLPVFYFSKQP